MPAVLSTIPAVATLPDTSPAREPAPVAPPAAPAEPADRFIAPALPPPLAARAAEVKASAITPKAIGWAPIATYERGSVSYEPGQPVVLHTADGRALELRDSLKRTGPFNMPGGTMRGFIHDSNGADRAGDLVVQGSPGPGNTFNVTGFALDLNGAFGTFVFGRVDDDIRTRVVIHTAEFGDVEVRGPTADVLRTLPRLGVILPGEPTPTREGDAEVKVYAPATAPDFFMLARPTGTPVAQPDGGYRIPHDLAWAPSHRESSSSRPRREASWTRCDGGRTATATRATGSSARSTRAGARSGLMR